MNGAARLGRLRRVARLVIFFEAVVAGFWPLACWIGAFVALWLFDVPAAFGHAAEIAATLVFLAGAVALAWHGWGAVRPTAVSQLDRRLESDAGLAHRPLAFLADHDATRGTDDRSALWQRQHQQAAITLQGMRAPRFRPQLATRDGLASRVAILLMLGLGIITAGPQAMDRLSRGLWPIDGDAGGQAGVGDPRLTVWITPPAYTHRPRLILTGGGSIKKPLDIPAGSTVDVRLRGGFFQPALTLGPAHAQLGATVTDDTRIWSGHLAGVAAGDERLRLRQGMFHLLSVPLHVVADAPPRLTQKKSPVILPKGGIQFDLMAQDDYGVTALVLNIKAAAGPAMPPLGEAQTYMRAAATLPGRQTEVQPVFDLTGHPWAGHPVILSIAARDGRGQMSPPVSVTLTLPERAFTNPAAQRLADLRRRLIAAPAAAPLDIASGIEDVMVHIGLYGGDAVTFLTLRSAASRLLWNRGLPAVSSVVDLLWQAALRIEDGTLGLAAGDLRMAQDNLQALLDRPNADPSQLSDAVDRIRTALGSYLGQLYLRVAQQAIQRGEQPPSLADFKRQIGADQVSAFLDRLQGKALAGDRDAVRAMAAQLQQMTDQLDPANAGAGMSPQAQAMMKTLQNLSALIAKERQLQAETRLRADAKTPVQNQAPDQDALRRGLGDIMSGVDGPIPQRLQQAEQAMRGSAAALGAGQASAALTEEQAAITQMQGAAQGMQQQLQRMAASGNGPTDPLGRPLNPAGGMSAESDVKVPDAASRRQVQDILQLLRDRSGQLQRPEYERDYYRRLMEQF